MGNAPSHPIFVALQELFASKKLKLSKKTLEKFLCECGTVAPWFAISGSLTIPSWEKLGKDLERARAEGNLRPGVRQVWMLVKSCIEDDKSCKDALEKGQKALQALQEERASSRDSKDSSDSSSDSSSESSSESEEESDKELKALVEKARALSVKKGKNKAKSKWREKEKWKEGKKKGEVTKEELEDPSLTQPTAPPPPYPEGCGRSRCPAVWAQARQEFPATAFPIFVDNQGQRYHTPLDFKTFKSLAESVRTYGTTASFTVAQLESLQVYCMTPSDWAQLAKACLSPGQYLDWKAFNMEYTYEQAAANAAAGGGRAAWDQDMLLGQGRFANQQNGYPDIVYGQINECAIKAWKSLPNKGEVAGNLTKITQGQLESFSDFVARMVEAAGRIFGDPDTAMPLIKQLVYEQCTKECRAAITPYKSRGLEAWMKVCREIGGPLTNAGLAAAVIQASKQERGRHSGRNQAGKCFQCGQAGHLKRDCPNRGGKGTSGPKPGLCPRCKKGNHWANECRSVKDIDGQPLSQGYGGARSKNGMRGPRPQGPQIYGAMEDVRENRQIPSMIPRNRGEPLRAQQDWTSAPPPDSY